MKIVADSYAWVEVFLGSAKGRAAKRRMEQATDIYTPDVVLVEVARKYVREGVDEELVRKRLSTMAEASEVVSVGLQVALESAKAYTELERKARNEKLSKPSLFDAFVLAAARINDARVLTGDLHFKGLAETMWMA